LAANVVLVSPPRQQSACKGNSCNYSHTSGHSCWDDALKRLTPKDIQNYLNAGESRLIECRKCFVAGLNRDTIGSDDLLIDQPIEGVIDAFVGIDRRRRAVQLNEIYDIYIEIPSAAVEPCPEVLEVVGLGNVWIGS
jgi:hypothetical protein